MLQWHLRLVRDVFRDVFCSAVKVFSDIPDRIHGDGLAARNMFAEDQLLACGTKIIFFLKMGQNRAPLPELQCFCFAECVSLTVPRYRYSG